MKTPRQLERYFKGVSNHRRIHALLLLANEGELSLTQITEKLKVNLQTMSEHMRRLKDSGLVDKKQKNREVYHSLSPYGKKMLATILAFQKLK